MIDNGYAFGFDGSEWGMRDRFVGKELSSLSDAYLSAQAEECFQATITSIQGVVATGFDAILRSVPADWMEDDMNLITRLLDDLGRRSKRLPDLLMDAKRRLADFVNADSAPVDKFLWDRNLKYLDLSAAAKTGR
jgi:hypothetical protein